MLPLLSALFFASGAAALVYQVLWLRLLGLVFGVTVHAASTVLAVFMGGLALGSFLAGRLADRVRRPLLWFAAAEAGIALSAVASPTVLDALQAGYVSIHPHLPPGAAGLTAARVAMTAAALIVPTVLMGATLPLVLRSSLVRHAALGPRVSLLYAANTTGAIVGTLAAGLYLIPTLGITRAFFVAAGINAAVAATATLAGVKLRAAVSPATAPGPSALRWSATRLLVLIVFAVSGFVGLAIEVVWFRLGVLLIRPTVYAFGIMLATLLGGIAIGSYMMAPLLKRRANWLAVLILLEVCLAVALVLSPAGLSLVPGVSHALQPVLAHVMPEYLPHLVVTSFLLIFPSAVLMGLAFPVGVVLFSGGREDRAGREVGLFYAVNVSCGIAGALLAGFVLLPGLGSRITTILLAFLVMASALILLPLLPRRALRRVALPVAAAVAVLVALAVQATDPFAIYLAQRFPRHRIISLEEGVQSTVSVHEYDPYRSLHLDGLHQASTEPGMAFVHRRIGGLGPAVHPEARNVLIVGMGGGATPGAAAAFPFTRVEVVELSAAVVHAADYFRELNLGLVSRPNVTIRIDDGRNFLMLSRQKYDVIAADLILPIHAGAGNVYSAEYFRLVREALDENGLAVQWIAGTEQEYRLIMRTFLSVFPETTLWADGSLMIGSKRPLRLSRSDFEWKLEVPGGREALDRVGFGSYDTLKRQFLAGPEELRHLVGEGPILTDDRPLVEYFLSLPREGSINLGALTGANPPFID
jgi:spermidine synthase